MNRGKIDIGEWESLSTTEQVRHACWHERKYLKRLDLSRIDNANDKAAILAVMPSAAKAIDINTLSDARIESLVSVHPSLLRRVSAPRRASLGLDCRRDCEGIAARIVEKARNLACAALMPFAAAIA